MSALSASRHATPRSATSSSTSLPSTTSKAPSKPKPVNVFSSDGSFLERFQRSKQEEEDKRKVEEAFAKKKQFADRFKNRGKRPHPPDSSPAVTSTDADPNPAKKPKHNDASQISPCLSPVVCLLSFSLTLMLDPWHIDSEYKKEVCDYAGRILKDTGTGVRPLVK